MVRRGLIVGLLLILILTTACQAKAEPAFEVEIVVEGEEAQDIFFAAYMGGKRCQIGDVSASRKLRFSRSELFLKDDVSDFELILVPYDDKGEHDTRFIKPLEIPASYGQVYRVVLSGTKTNGYSLRLE